MAKKKKQPKSNTKAIRKTSTPLPLRRRRRKMPRKLTYEEKDNRIQFVMTLVANRFSYPEIAKAVAQKYGMTLKGAYLFLSRINTKAVKEWEQIDAGALISAFQRIIFSLEDTIKKAKASGDYKAAIQGESALAKMFGFDKGSFLPILKQFLEGASKPKARALPPEAVSKPGPDEREELAQDMNALSVEQLHRMLEVEGSNADQSDDTG